MHIHVRQRKNVGMRLLTHEKKDELVKLKHFWADFDFPGLREKKTYFLFACPLMSQYSQYITQEMNFGESLGVRAKDFITQFTDHSVSQDDFLPCRSKT